MSWSRGRDSILHLLRCSWLRFLLQEFLSPCLCLLLCRALGVEDWWKQFLRILLHFNNVFLAPWKKTSRRQTVSAKSRAGCGKRRTLLHCRRKRKHLHRHFWQWSFQVSEMKGWKKKNKKKKQQQYPVSHNRWERRLYRDLKGGQCEMSAVTLAPILLWLHFQLSPVNERNSYREDSGGWWSGTVPQPAKMTSLPANSNKQCKMYSLAGVK